MVLRAKQQAFVEHYLKCWNATEAAIKAEYSKRTARQQGSRLLTNVDIKAAIEERLNELKMSADEVLIRLAEQARGDMGEFMGKDTQELIDHPRSHLIKKYEVHRKTDKHENVYETVKVELHDSQTALLNIGKQHGLFTPKIHHEGEIDINLDAKTGLIEKLEHLAEQLNPVEDDDSDGE